MDIGKMKVSEAMPYMKSVADEFGLNLNLVKEWKIARSLVSMRFNN